MAIFTDLGSVQEYVVGIIEIPWILILQPHSVWIDCLFLTSLLCSIDMLFDVIETIDDNVFKS